jgi:hypothetical protein
MTHPDSDAAALRRDAQKFIQNWNAREDDFNGLAMRVFAHQFARNRPFRAYCSALGASPGNVSRWQDVPALPVDAFRWADVACADPHPPAAVFHTSGTTSEQTGRHIFGSLDLYEAAAFSHFKRACMPDMDRMRMFILTQPPDEAPHSSLVWMLDLLRRRLGDGRSRFFVHRDAFASKDAIEMDDFIAAARRAAEDRSPVFILSTHAAAARLLRRCAHLPFPAGSRLMVTGGSKNIPDAMGPSELLRAAAETWAIPPERVFGEYGMTELSSQCYTHPAAAPQPAESLETYYPPPWMRVRVVDPSTGADMADGAVQAVDMANIDSCAFILTADRAARTGEGFRLLGRLSRAVPRGCSLAAAGVKTEG